MSTNPNTPAAVSVTRSIDLILATAGKGKKDLAELLDVAPSGVTRRYKKGTWSIAEMELICAQVGAPITALFDGDALGHFLAERTHGAPDLRESSTKWYTRDRQPALAGA